MSTINAAATTPINAGGFNTPGGQVAYGGTAYSGTFIPTLWSGKLAQKFYASTVFGEIANTDWQGEINSIGDSVIINTIPTITINDYKIGQNLSYEVPAPVTITLSITKGKYFGVNVNSVLELQSKPKLMDMFTTDAAEQMKVQIDADVMLSSFQGADAANKGSAAGAVSGSYGLGTDAVPIGLTAGTILDYITKMSSVLDEANVPEQGRFLVLSPAERQMLMNSNLTQAQFMGDSTSVLRNGKIGNIDRFDVYVSNLIPRVKTTNGNWNLNANYTGTGPVRHAIIAGHKSAITFASQITKVESLQNPNDFGTLVRGLNVYGSQVTTPKALALLIAAN